MKTLFRTFFTQFFTSETVTSDAQLRQAIAGVLAFVITPCLLLFPRGFGQYQPLAYSGRMERPAAVIIRLNAVRALAFADAIAAAVGLLIAYSMITIGLVAAYAWDALTFDRRDAMVLGPLPLRASTIMTAKLAALGALLLGASVGIGILNSFLFALETADRAGWHAFIVSFFACLVVTTGAAIVVFSVVVIARSLVVILGGARLAGLLGSAFQLLLVVAILEPPGQRIRLINPRMPSANQNWLTVVGVSPMVRQHYARDFDPVVYVPYRSSPAPAMIVMARAARTGVQVAGRLRSTLSSIDAELPLVSVTTLDQFVAGTRFANEAFATMFSTFAAIALLLAAIGLHGVTAYAVTQRTKEIGIRMALGAQTSSITWMFVRRTLPALIIGVTFGIGAAVGMGEFVRSMLAGTSPHDPATLAGITVILVIVVLASTLVPAQRVANLDPAVALRHD